MCTMPQGTKGVCVPRETGVGKDPQARQLATTSPDSSVLTQGQTQRQHPSKVATSTPETNFRQGHNFQTGWSYHRDRTESHRGSLDHPSVGPSQPDQSPSRAYENSRHRANSTLANSMMRTVVASDNDALNILFEAATAQEDVNPDASSESLAGPPSAGPSTQNRTPGNYDSASESVARVIHPVKLSDATQDTLNIWEACRFVKMGWFTAREAVTLIDLCVPSHVPYLCQTKLTEVGSIRICLVYLRF
ncbi:Peptidase T2 asparaginase 2 [Penicillium vulpinum]|uniref:Peptidase T2 asparaginase 2 n=1 Tax=Penicillium vulpinum TaxID=29845 RepID=UPI002547208A|nr:Peptidase T2 asparaginase 2 [Penicillium vulpinum]KAJ5959473.1 Peptidase T2 asparaginase 2 [Penicillium vulpinum]